MVIQLEKIKISIKTLAVDTNILLWAFYGNTTYVQSYQKNIYPTFLANTIERKDCKIYTTIYNICELFNIIEKNEYELYLKKNELTSEELNKKQYRALIEEREKLQRSFNLLYKQISQCVNITEYQISEEMIKEYNKNYNQHRYDIFDFTLLKFCKENNIECVLTDDSDFSSYKEYISDIKIITANRNLK